MCSVPWPLNRSEAGGDLVLLQAFLLYMCKSWYSHANKPVNMIIYIWKTRRFVTASLASIQRPEHWAQNFKMAYYTFLNISLPLFCTITTWNFQKRACYMFNGGSVVFLFTFFSLPLIFTLVAASISHFLTAATKFSCCSPNKKCLLCRSFLVELRWPVAYFLFFSVFLFLYIPNLWTWQLI